MSVDLQSTSRRRAAARRRARVPHAPRRPASRVAAALAATVSAQRDGGPQDAAFYECGCGCRFRAWVSTSVGCPACGVAQAW
jgi:hypothetical protein